MTDYYEDVYGEEEEIQPFPTYSIQDLANLPEPQWLVKDLVPERAYGVVFGPPGVGKTFVGLDIACTMATGLDWQGKRVKEGLRVLYAIGEGQFALRRRLLAWVKAHPDADAQLLLENLALMPKVPHVASHKDFQSMLRTTAGRDFVVMDTLARCMRGMDDNSAKDVGTANDFAQRIRDEHGSTVMYVHHSGKDGTVERGSVALRGDADFMLKLKPGNGSGAGVPGGFQLIVDKQKDGPEGHTYTMQLTTIELGRNQFDEPVTSAVVKRVGDFAGAGSSHGVRVPTAPANFGAAF